MCGLSTRDSLTEVFMLTGFCPQLKGLWEHLTLRQHLLLLLQLKGLTGGALLAAAIDVEEQYGLSEHAHKAARKLSGGTKRKLSAAIALSCGSPRVILVDEPTTGVDVGTRRFIWDRIREVAKTATVLLSDDAALVTAPASVAAETPKLPPTVASSTRSAVHVDGDDAAADVQSRL